MKAICLIQHLCKLIAVASFFIICIFGDNNHAFAQTAKLDGLFEQLHAENADDYKKIEEKIWREWRKSGSDAVDLLLERGMEAMEQDEFIAAIEHFSAAIDHAPDFAEAWNMRATAFFNMGEFGLSVADIQETLRLNPRHFGALGGFGLILEYTERPKQAQEVYNRLLEVHPNSAEAQEAADRLKQQLQGTSL